MISDNKPKLNDFIKIKCESDDNLPFGELLNIPVCVIIVKSVFAKNSNYYPQVYLHECLKYEHKEHKEYEHKDENDFYFIV